VQFIYSQVPQVNITFDDSTWVNYISIDTINYPNNIWQIGKPNKEQINSAWSLPNAIITDTVNPYPINDTSVFYIRYITPNPTSGVWTGTIINFWYWIYSDNPTDYGMLEFSPDNGQTWINYSYDTVWNECHNEGYYFTGDGYWDGFIIASDPGPDCFNIEKGDTIYYRFTFISDGFQTSKDGWAIDDITLWDMYEVGNIDRFEEKIIFNIFPIPANNNVIFESSKYSSFRSSTENKILITNSFGQPITQIPFTGNKTFYDCRHLPPGIYFYQFQTNEKTYSGKFMIIK
jgi:hypothetical protein